MSDVIGYYDLGLNVKSLLEEHVEILSTAMGVEFSDEASLYSKFTITSRVSSIEDLDKGILPNIDSLKNILIEDNVELFSFILESLFGVTVDLMDNVYHVDGELIQSILDTLESDEEVDLLEEIKRKRLIKILKDNTIKPSLGLMELIKNIDLNTSVSNYITWYSSVLHSERMETVINDVLTILLFSVEGRESISDTYFGRIEPLIIDNGKSTMTKHVVDFINTVHDDLDKINKV
jgi:hypothetical protein